MDLMGLIAILRWPLEIVAFALALIPLLSVLLAWPYLPAEIPTHFSLSGRPDRWGSRARVWILPALALVVYGFMNQVSGTWAWAFLGNMELPAGAEFPISKLGKLRLPENPETGISARAWEMIKNAALSGIPEEATDEVAHLVEARQQARFRQDWANADILRQKIATLGWLVQDTPEGQIIIRQP